MIFPTGFPMFGGLFSSIRQVPQQQSGMYGSPFGMPQQGGMGMGYMPPYLMQYMQQFGMPMQQPNMPMQQLGMPMQQLGMPMQQPNMPMQQPDMNYLGQQAAGQHLRQIGALGQLGQPAVPGGQGFPPPQQRSGPVAEPQPLYPMNQYQSQMGTAPNGASIQNPMLSINPEQTAQRLRAITDASANALQSRRATILPPAPPAPIASSPIRTTMAAPVNTASIGDVRSATGGSLADALRRTPRARTR